MVQLIVQEESLAGASWADEHAREADGDEKVEEVSETDGAGVVHQARLQRHFWLQLKLKYKTRVSNVLNICEVCYY